MDPRMKYADLRLALEWAETAKERINENTDYALSEDVKTCYAYLSSYCKSINLEGK